MLKKAITVKKEEQVETPPVPVLADMTTVREDRVEQRLTTLEEAMRGLIETLMLGMGYVVYQAQETDGTPLQEGRP